MQTDELIGTTLGNYRILAPLGQGGMARVYRAHQENLDREVAVKVLPPWYAADRSFVERFNLEAKLVARLSHSNIVMVHDAGEQNGHIYIVMQLIDGGTLKQRLDQLQAQGQTMDVVEANQIFKQIASALTYAHEKGIIHRDVKPVNVLMDQSGRPILSDFGIAKVLASTREQLTRPGAGVGTPEYMSPEQCRGEQVDASSDIYALGVMLFEALTGRTPFRGDNYPALAHSHIYEMPPHPSAINPRINAAVDQVILTALMKIPQQRYQQANRMADAFEQAIAQGGQGGNAYLPGKISPESQALQGSVYGNPASLIVCPNCKHVNKPQMRFCTKCGSSLVVRICRACGSQNRASNRFCTRCGQALPMLWPQ